MAKIIKFAAPAQPPQPEPACSCSSSIPAQAWALMFGTSTLIPPAIARLLKDILGKAGTETDLRTVLLRVSAYLLTHGCVTEEELRRELNIPRVFRNE